MPLRVTFDRSANAAYIQLTDTEAGQITEQHLCDGIKRGEIIFDLDKHGRLLGIEFLNATKLLPYDLLRGAERLR